MNTLILDNINLEFENQNYNIIYTNFSNYVLSESKNKLYLFDHDNKPSKNYNFISNFSNHWFRDLNKRDIFFDNFSIPQIINRNLNFSLLNDIKNFIALKYWIKKFNKIKIYSNNSSLNRISKYFKEIEIINTQEDFKDHIPATPERSPYIFVKQSLLKNLFFKIEKIFDLKSKKNKILVMPGVYGVDQLEQKDLLYLNKKNFISSFYLNFSKECENISISEKILDTNNYSYSLKIFKNFFDDEDADILCRNFYNLAHDMYFKNKKKILFTINTIVKTLDFYNPKGIILSSSTSFDSQIICQYCKIKKIKTFLLLDGYNFFYQNHEFSNDENDNIYFDYFFSFGKSFKKVLLDNKKIKEQKIIELNVPDFIDRKKTKKNIYDCCIVSYDVNVVSLNTTWDKKTIVEISILNALQELGYKKVAIKLKSSTSVKAKSEILNLKKIYKIFEKIYKKKLIIEIEFKRGEFSETLCNSGFVIGGFSTAFIESNQMNIPYYLYEPNVNGYNNLEDLKIIDSKFVIRSELDLYNSLKSKIYPKINFEKENNIDKNSKVNLEKFIN